MFDNVNCILDAEEIYAAITTKEKKPPKWQKENLSPTTPVVA